MSRDSKLRIAVLTDLHAGDNESLETWVYSAKKPEEPCPFRSLEEMIKEENLNCDYLLLCGDVADKANFSGQKYAWEKVNKVGQILACKNVIGTVGNHDLDSRFFKSDFDPKGNLLSLEPDFPGVSREYTNHYWARNYSLLDNEDYLLLNINSCAFHGYSNDKPTNSEWEHGRISQQTISSIKKDVAEINLEDKLKVAFFHHHPIKWDKAQLEEKDSSEMKGGSDLISFFSECHDGPWLVIHGHKHHPDIIYAPGGSSSPIIISAGSFSSKRLSSNSSKNQFYIIDIERKPLESVGIPVAGTINSWTWEEMKGWVKSKRADGIPDGAGFGWRESAQAVAKNIYEIVHKNDPNYTTWSEIESSNMKIRYLLPDDRLTVEKILREKYKIVTYTENNGRDSQLSIKKE